MKKLFLVLAVTAILAAPVMAQESSAKIAVSLDLFPLVKGILWSNSDMDRLEFALAPAVEFLLAPHFSMGIGADLYFGSVRKDVSIFYTGVAAHGRYYPLSTGLDKFFLDAGVGINLFALDGEFDKDKGGFFGLTLALKAGYKLMFTPSFFAEPSLSYVYAKTTEYAATPLGWQPGLNIGFAF